MAAACLILALIGWGVYYTRAAQVARHATEKMQEKIDVMHGAEGQLEKLKKQAASIDSLATPLIDAVNDRSFWVEVMEDLNKHLPEENIWITELIPTSGGKPVGVDEKRLAEFAPTPTPTPAGSRPKPNPAKPSGPVIDGLFVRGLYLFNPKQQEVVVDYFRNLAGIDASGKPTDSASPYFAIDVKNQARVIKPTTPNNTDWAFPYELHLDLARPMKLP
jgi:hypothetical protein